MTADVFAGGHLLRRHLRFQSQRPVHGQVGDGRLGRPGPDQPVQHGRGWHLRHPRFGKLRNLKRTDSKDLHVAIKGIEILIIPRVLFRQSRL